MSKAAEKIETARRRYVAAQGTDMAGARYLELVDAVRAAQDERTAMTIARIQESKRG